MSVFCTRASIKRSDSSFMIYDLVFISLFSYYFWARNRVANHLRKNMWFFQALKSEFRGSMEVKRIQRQSPELRFFQKTVTNKIKRSVWFLRIKNFRNYICFHRHHRDDAVNEPTTSLIHYLSIFSNILLIELEYLHPCIFSQAIPENY